MFQFGNHFNSEGLSACYALRYVMVRIRLGGRGKFQNGTG
jgi:hypothetical protein